jgi:sigma-E factor negative regulatory protein RseB
MRTLPVTAVLAVLVALAPLQVAAGEPDARVWLDDMNQAFSDLSYDGVFSFYSGSDLAALRVVHMVIDGEQRERLVHLNGAPREIIRRGEEVACILMPGDELLELNIPKGPFARAFVRRYDRISDNYGFAFFGEDRIAGRDAVRLAVMPLDQDRFGYRLWLDRDTRLLLRSELVDHEGNRLEIFQFNTLKLGDEVRPEALEPSVKQGEIRDHLQLASRPAIPVTEPDVHWSTGWLPPGFSMTAADVRQHPETASPISTMMYSDGLAAFSVFIEDVPPTGATDMVTRNGATVAVTHLTEGPEQKEHLVTVVGELPTATARRIAEAIRFGTH